MNNVIKSAFDSVSAPQILKRHTADYVIGKKRKKLFIPKAALATVCTVAIVLFSLYFFYSKPTAIISIDINPSLEIAVNGFDKVISLTGFNDDGQRLADEINVKNMDYAGAVDLILSSGPIQDCLSENLILTMTVVSDNESQSSKIISTLNSRTAGNGNIYCYSCSFEQVRQAHECGFSYGKYMAYLRLKEVYPDITEEEAAQMTMKEIHRLTDYYCENGGHRYSGGNDDGRRRHRHGHE